MFLSFVEANYNNPVEENSPYVTSYTNIFQASGRGNDLLQISENCTHSLTDWVLAVKVLRSQAIIQQEKVITVLC
jgi:hypothetical protein